MQDEFSQQLEQFSLVVDDLEQQLNARLAAEHAAAAVQAAAAATAVTPSLVPLATQYIDDFAAPDSSLSEDTDTDTDSVLASKHYKTCSFDGACCQCLAALMSTFSLLTRCICSHSAAVILTLHKRSHTINAIAGERMAIPATAAIATSATAVAAVAVVSDSKKNSSRSRPAREIRDLLSPSPSRYY
jgi:hypothetical protein